MSLFVRLLSNSPFLKLSELMGTLFWFHVSHCFTHVVSLNTIHSTDVIRATVLSTKALVCIKQALAPKGISVDI